MPIQLEAHKKMLPKVLKYINVCTHIKLFKRDLNIRE